MTACSMRLAELLATRLCHDLAGPLGGLCVALGEAPRDAEALLLAQDATLELRRRFTLLRAAWGNAPPSLGASELRDLALGLANARRLNFELDLRPPDARLAPESARVALNVLLLGAECLPRGGVLALAGDPSGQMIASIAGPRAAWPAGLGVVLGNPEAAWAAIDALAGAAEMRGLQAPLTALLAAAAGVRVSLLLAPAAEATPPLLLDFSASAS